MSLRYSEYKESGVEWIGNHTQELGSEKNKKHPILLSRWYLG